MHSYLQTKAVSLALEAQYIRKQSNRFHKMWKHASTHGKDRMASWAKNNRQGQYLHRIGVVRNEARITHLARAFLKGYEYSKIERTAYTQPDWNRIANLIYTYGERDRLRFNRDLSTMFHEWKDRAIVHYETQERGKKCET